MIKIKYVLFKHIADKIDNSITHAEMLMFCGLLNDLGLARYIKHNKDVPEKYKMGFLNQKLKIQEKKTCLVKKC